MLQIFDGKELIMQDDTVRQPKGRFAQNNLKIPESAVGDLFQPAARLRRDGPEFLSSLDASGIVCLNYNPC
jgi:hypothetical protein